MSLYDDPDLLMEGLWRRLARAADPDPERDARLDRDLYRRILLDEILRLLNEKIRLRTLHADGTD